MYYYFTAPITERQKSISLDNEIATKLDPNGAAKTHPTFSKVYKIIMCEYFCICFL